MVKKIYLFVFISFIFQTYTYSYPSTELEKIKEEYYYKSNDSLVKSLGLIGKNKQTSKNTCSQSIHKVCETTQLGNKFDVTKLSSSDIKFLASNLKASKILPAYFDLDGCFERNLKVSKYLQSRGIKAGTLVIYHSSGQNIEYSRFPRSPEFSLEWTYHIAPFVYNQSGERVVFDLALAGRPLTEEAWKNQFFDVYGEVLLTSVAKSVGIFESKKSTYLYEYDWSELSFSEKTLLLNAVNKNLALQKTYDKPYLKILGKAYKEYLLKYN